MCLCASVSAGHSLGACSEEYRYCLCDERHGFKEVSMRTYTLLCPRGTAMLFVAQHPHTSSTGTRLSRLSSIRTHIGDGHRPSRRLPIQPEALSLRTFSATRREKLMALTAILLMFSPIRRGILMPLTGIFLDVFCYSQRKAYGLDGHLSDIFSYSERDAYALDGHLFLMFSATRRLFFGAFRLCQLTFSATR